MKDGERYPAQRGFVRRPAHCAVPILKERASGFVVE
jgi:hypothetical protein